MLLCNKMIPRQMICGSQHRFSERHVAVVLHFQGHLLASRSNIERAVNVGGPTRIQEQSGEELELAGKVLVGSHMLTFYPSYRALCPGLPFRHESQFNK